MCSGTGRRGDYDALQHPALQRLVAALVLAPAAAPALLVGLGEHGGRLSGLQHRPRVYRALETALPPGASLASGRGVAWGRGHRRDRRVRAGAQVPGRAPLHAGAVGGPRRAGARRRRPHVAGRERPVLLDAARVGDVRPVDGGRVPRMEGQLRRAGRPRRGDADRHGVAGRGGHRARPVRRGRVRRAEPADAVAGRAHVPRTWSPFGASSNITGSPQAEFDIPYGNLAQNGGYAMIANRYAAEYGYDPRATAKIAADQRANAGATPTAVFRDDADHDRRRAGVEDGRRPAAPAGDRHAVRRRRRRRGHLRRRRPAGRQAPPRARHRVRRAPHAQDADVRAGPPAHADRPGRRHGVRHGRRASAPTSTRCSCTTATRSPCCCRSRTPASAPRARAWPSCATTT